MNTLRTTVLGSTQSMMDYIKTGETKYNQLSEEASSGIKVNTPSDDPTAAKNILDITSQLNQLNGYVNNMKTSQSELNTLDDSLTSLTTMIQNATNLATQAANGTYNTSDLNNIKTQVDSIINSVVSLANTQYNGKYIFAGTATSTIPYTVAADGSITYNGTPAASDSNRYVTISDGVSVAINITGDSVFGSYTQGTLPATPTGTGLLGNLKALSNALGNNGTTTYNGATVTPNSSLDVLSSNLNTVTTAQTKFAAITNRFKMTEDSMSNTILNLTSQKSDLQNADLTQVLTDLTAQQTALQATYKITSQMLSGKTLLDYI